MSEMEGDGMTDLEDAFARALRLAAEGKNYTQSQARPDVPPAEEIHQAGDRPNSNTLHLSFLA